MYPNRIRSILIRTPVYSRTNRLLISSKLTITLPPFSSWPTLFSSSSSFFSTSFVKYYSSTSSLFISYSERQRRKRLRMTDSLSSSITATDDDSYNRPYLLEFPTATYLGYQKTQTESSSTSSPSTSTSFSSTSTSSTSLSTGSIPPLSSTPSVTPSTNPKLHGYAWYRSIGSPRSIVAPMVDQSELVFRLLCKEYGAQLGYTPMLHSRLMLERIHFLETNFATAKYDHPVIAQLCGNDPDIVLQAAMKLQPYVNAIDLNLGCPQGIAKKGNYGAFLLDDPDTIVAIVNKLHQHLTIPVTCKIRILKTLEMTVNFAKRLETAGCSLLTVHGRERHENKLLVRNANWDVIKAVKAALTIPVFANGSVGCYQDIQDCIDYTGCDGVMSSESLLENPGLFSKNVPDTAIQIKHNHGLITDHHYYYPIDYTVQEIKHPRKRSSYENKNTNNSATWHTAGRNTKDDEASKDDSNTTEDASENSNSKRARVDDGTGEANTGSSFSSSSSSSSSSSDSSLTTTLVPTTSIVPFSSSSSSSLLSSSSSSSSSIPSLRILPPSLSSNSSVASSTLSLFPSSSKLYRPCKSNQLDLAQRYLQLYDLYGIDSDFIYAKGHIFKFLFGMLRVYHDIRDLIHHTHEYKHLNTFKKCVEELQYRFQKEWYPKLYDTDPLTGELVYKPQYQMELHALYQIWEQEKLKYPNLGYCTPEYLIDPSQPGAWYMRYRTGAYGGRKPPFTESVRANNSKVPLPPPIHEIFTNTNSTGTSALTLGSPSVPSSIAEEEEFRNDASSVPTDKHTEGMSCSSSRTTV